MPNSQPWNNEVYIRFNLSSISKEFDIALGEIEDYQAFVVSRKSLTLNVKEFFSNGYYVYATPLGQLNEIKKKLSYPVVDGFWNSTPSIKVRGGGEVSDYPLIMTILNLTPDSFYPGSRVSGSEIEEKLDLLKREGAKLVDIGGQSTRPGSIPVSGEEELNRIRRAVEISLDKKFIVSIDSYRPEVLKECLEMGSHIINDVTGMENLEVGKLAKKYDVPLIIMHKKGDFKTMQVSPHYDNVVQEIMAYFLLKIEEAKRIGIEDNIIFDPGIGFGKRIEDNIAIIKNLRDFKFGHPLMIGLSRKHFIGKILDERVDERGVSSLIFNAIAIQNGADIIRVHDFTESTKLIKIIKKLREV